MKKLYFIIIVALQMFSLQIDSAPLDKDNFWDPMNMEFKFVSFAKELSLIFTNICLIVNHPSRVQEIASKIDIKELNILMFTNSEKYEVFNIKNAAESIWKSPNFDNKHLTIYLHGFNDYPDEPKVKFVVDKYFKIGMTNLFSVNMSTYIFENYFDSSAAVPRLGQIIGDFVSDMYNKGMPWENIHMIGYSLGAHVAAFASRQFKSRNNLNIHRITGLDPASPCFYTTATSHLTQYDAFYVDTIHTSFLSVTNRIVGHADYYANGRIGFQPECYTNISCHHQRSIYLYGESVANTDGFLSTQCTGLNNLRTICNTNNLSNMGYKSDPNSRGIYFFRTNNQYPYAQGKYGII